MAILFTNIPIISLVSGIVLLATGEPITISGCPVYLYKVINSDARNTLYGDICISLAKLFTLLKRLESIVLYILFPMYPLLAGMV